MTNLLSDLKALVAKYDAQPTPDPVPVPDPIPTPDPVPTPVPAPAPTPDPVPAPVPTPVPTPTPGLPMPDVSTAAELAAAIASAQAGDTITLAGGMYGALSLSGKSGITISAADPAIRPLFSAIALTKCQNMALDGLAVSRPSQAGDTDNNVKAVLLDSCDGVSLTRCDMELQKALSGAYAGSTNGFTVYLDQSQNVTIRGNDIRGGKRAVMLQYADGVLVEGNEIHDFRAVAVGGSGNNVTIRGNYLHDAHPWNYPASDHGDFIHLWDGKGKPPIIGIVIEDNTIMQGAGVPIMGISIQNTQGSYFVDVRVANNLIITENNQCLRFDGVRDIDVQYNTFLSPVAEHPSNTGVGGQARFQIGGAQSGIVKDNIWGGISSPLPNCTVTGNLTMKFAQQTAILANPQGTTRADFLARADGPGAGLGIR